LPEVGSCKVTDSQITCASLVFFLLVDPFEKGVRVGQVLSSYTPANSLDDVAYARAPVDRIALE
tara:strand:+ start:123 stop:314 length:192 start_codon:yes stop_codon:yes gene_type:complete